MQAVDKIYCSLFGIFNPYKTFPYKLSNDIPKFDKPAYKRNPRHQFVYDKLFVADSQGMKCGRLEDLKDPAYPIFIKPRYGHLSASSKNCYKITEAGELDRHRSKKDMMWSEFVNATEGMTDFMLVDGEIVHQITYVYSEKQNGFSDDWKYISPLSKPPPEVVEWVQKYMAGYSGPVNVQYRSTKIIEVGLRFARSGMYIESTHNQHLIECLNETWATKTWSQRDPSKLEFTPFYSFKCWSPIPVLYILPQHVIDLIMRQSKSMPFYEYYFEPTGTRSLIFFQFLNADFKRGMRAKKLLENIMLGMNCLFVLLILAMIVRPNFYLGVVILILVASNLLNSLDVILHQFKNQLQFIG